MFLPRIADGAVWGALPGGAPAAIAVVATIVCLATARAIARSLPEHPRVEPAPPGDLLPGTLDAMRDLQALGFVPLGGAQVPNLHPAPLVLPFVHRDRGTLAAVHELRTPSPRTAVDFVTGFACGATLTTSNARDAATLPPPDGAFLQVRPGAAVADLAALHRDGVATLRAAGRRTNSTATTSLADFVHALLSHLRAQRDALDQAPLRIATIALWRTLVGCRHHARPLHEQLGGDATPALAKATR